MERKRPTPSDLETYLGELVASCTSAHQWGAVIETADKIGKYSTRNRALLVAQRPSVRSVAGYSAWQDAGRQVAKGERALWILAPRTSRTSSQTDDQAQDYEAPDLTAPTERTATTDTGQADSDKPRKINGAKLTKVFDVSQTFKTGPCPVCGTDTETDCAPACAGIPGAPTQTTNPGDWWELAVSNLPPATDPETIFQALEQVVARP